MNISLIIPAGGSGNRFGGGLPKQFTLLNGIPIIIRSIKPFEQLPEIKSIIISTMPHWINYTFDLLKAYPISKNIRIVNSGKERQDSVYNALLSDEASKSDLVLIHDAVRPLVTQKLIRSVISSAHAHGAAVPGLPPRDTVRIVTQDLAYQKTIPRINLRLIQTPQGFKKEIIVKAYEEAIEKKYQGTDDSSLVDLIGKPVKIVDGDDKNIKITTQLDLKLAELLILTDYYTNSGNIIKENNE